MTTEGCGEIGAEPSESGDGPPRIFCARTREPVCDTKPGGVLKLAAHEKMMRNQRSDAESPLVLGGAHAGNQDNHDGHEEEKRTAQCRTCISHMRFLARPRWKLPLSTLLPFSSSRNEHAAAGSGLSCSQMDAAYGMSRNKHATVRQDDELPL
jgi:hypothetical protein